MPTPASRKRDQAAVDELDGADVDAARRLADEQHLGVALDLARQHDLLLIAAGELRGLQPRRLRAHVVMLHLGRADPRPCDRGREAGPVRAAGRPQSREWRSRKPERPEPGPCAGGPPARAEGRAGASGAGCARRSGIIAALEADGAQDRLAHARDRFEQLALAVAGNAGDADDLARVNGERRRSRLAGRRVNRSRTRLSTSSSGSPGSRSDFSTRSSTRRPTISSASSGGEVSAVSTRRHHLAAPHDRDAVGDRHDLAQLVGDEDDGLALSLQRPQQVEQRVRLRRRQHGRRLVEDEDVGAAIERLQNFDALLQADGQVADDGVARRSRGRNRAADARAPRAPSPRLPRSRTPPSAPSMTFSTTVSVSTSMKCWCTMPMPAAIASAGERMEVRLAADADLARNRPRRSRRGSTSASTCPRRSRRRCRGSCRARP